MTPTESRSLLRGGMVLLLLSLVRLAVDQARFGAEPLPSDPSVLPDLLAESEAERAEEDRRSRPLAPGETLDPNRSEEAELDRLPGIGPATARAIVNEREEGGAFLEIRDLLRVRGIGPATLEKILPWLDLKGGLPLVGTSKPAASLTPSLERSPPSSRVAEPPTSIDVNSASAAELETLPGIGPALAERIVQSRASEGRFSSLDDLLRVRGIGPVVLSRIRPLLRTGG